MEELRQGVAERDSRLREVEEQLVESQEETATLEDAVKVTTGCVLVCVAV